MSGTIKSPEEQARVDQIEAELQAQLKQLTGVPGIQLSKIKL